MVGGVIFDPSQGCSMFVVVWEMDLCMGSRCVFNSARHLEYVETKTNERTNELGS